MAAEVFVDHAGLFLAGAFRIGDGIVIVIVIVTISFIDGNTTRINERRCKGGGHTPSDGNNS
jgi:hypothetical protein